MIKRGPGYKEFITLMAVIISITALSIDMMLPALPDIGRDLGVGHPNDLQLVVSVIMAVFIFVPAVAPAFGQVILLKMSWRAIFSVLMIQGLIALTWFTIRQPETLPKESRIPLSVRRILNGLVEVCTNRLSIGYPDLL